jgi:hypothetical protein
MNLMLQLGSRDLPSGQASPWGEGLLQAWTCTSEKPKLCQADEGWEPFARSQLVRCLPYGETVEAATDSPAREPFAERWITGWLAQDDFPDPEEHSDLGIALSDDETDAFYDLELPLGGDKFLGWPMWVQGAEYPDCPECGEPMVYVFQIDSEDNVPRMWGDSGCGHITMCKNHPERLAWAWACC